MENTNFIKRDTINPIKMTMNVKVHILRGPLSKIVGKKEVTLQTENHVRVIDVLNLLSERYGKPFRKFVFNPKTSEINSYLILALNGVHIGCMNGIETIIEDGSELLILSATGGG
jgi:molybdopterin converting factor small subunit